MFHFISLLPHRFAALPYVKICSCALAWGRSGGSCTHIVCEAWPICPFRCICRRKMEEAFFECKILKVSGKLTSYNQSAQGGVFVEVVSNVVLSRYFSLISNPWMAFMLFCSERWWGGSRDEKKMPSSYTLMLSLNQHHQFLFTQLFIICIFELRTLFELCHFKSQLID